ncbi:22302_t:CDS:2 [Gigaspora margarita]|uniref:22302_t:CDS:1 n=1 Tax=Gigaspora margarita TaxID=4874 RepID=A0ABN7VWW3_GIGMA|nr:22302_t:CDS:2 [Gigaspora margarita]
MTWVNYQKLNSSDVSLSGKEDALRWIQFSNEYQLNLVGGVIGKGLGAAMNAVAGKMAEKTARIVIRSIPGLRGIREGLIGVKDLIGQLAGVKNEQEFLDKANALITAQELLLARIEEDVVGRKDLLNLTRENLLSLSKSNVAIYVRDEENYLQHCQINRKVNELLKRVKNHQRNLHQQNQCCPKCRFC